jgi:hypothetical protein
MGEVAGVTRNEIPIGPWHVRVVMHGAIDLQPRKRGPKWPVTTTYIVNEIANLLASSQLLRSDPDCDPDCYFDRTRTAAVSQTSRQTVRDL